MDNVIPIQPRRDKTKDVYEFLEELLGNVYELGTTQLVVVASNDSGDPDLPQMVVGAAYGMTNIDAMDLLALGLNEMINYSMEKDDE